MHKTRNLIFIIASIVLVVLGFTAFSTYNSLASMREGIAGAEADIQTQLQRRADLVPNLVNTVKGLSAQEQKVIDSVTNARARLIGAQGIQEQAAANDELSAALSRLLVVVENYPEIKSNEAYVSLMDELSGTENRISAARTDYNDAVRSYNSKIVRLPTKLFAALLGFEKEAYFEAPQSAQDAPNVDFGS